LRTRAEIETVVDFGDRQIFQGVTTYPAIVTMRRSRQICEAGHAGDMRFFKIKTEVPKELGRAFCKEAQSMPRTRLGDGSWQFEDDRLAALRAKIVGGKKTLGEVYGSPLRGIVTGLNDAFIVSRERRDELVARDARSAELLVPFLRGENVKRWRVESEDLFLVNIPKGKVRIDDFPAIRDHLLPFKDKLEARATKQEWFELQQAQLAYQPKFVAAKAIYAHFAHNRGFAFDRAGAFCNDKSYFIPDADYGLLAYLNSRLCWYLIAGMSPAVRGGFYELRVQYIEKLSIPQEVPLLAAFSARAAEFAGARSALIRDVLHRITDLCPPARPVRLTNKLREWWRLDFKSFQGEIMKSFKSSIPLKERSDWEGFLRESAETVRALDAQIEQAEREIDSAVYRLFELTEEEIALLESSLAGQY
jgi:hypothetical protein